MPHHTLRTKTAAFLLAFGLAAAISGCSSGKTGAAEPAKAGGGGANSTIDPLSKSALRERAVSLLIEQTSAAEPQYRANAVELLTRTPQRLRPVLARTLTDENIGVRAVSAYVVGKAQLSDQVNSVLALQNDPSPYVRASAIYALRRCSPTFDPTPLSALLHDPSPKVRAHVAVLIGDLGDRSALPMLREAAREILPMASQAEVRMMQLQVAEARVKLGDDTAVHEIRAALYPSRPEELEATALAVQIIGNVNDRAAIDQLIYLTARFDEQKRYMPAEVRLAAAASLAKLGLPRGSFIANEYIKDPNPTLRSQAAYVLGETGQESNFAVLEPMLSDEFAMVRIYAAGAIVRICDR